MNRFLFHHEDFERFYNCSIKSYDEWLSYGSKQYGLGVLFLVLGSIYILLYIPCLIVMAQPKLFQYSCWRIMFFLGIIDILSTVINSIIPSYYGIRGVVGCNHMTEFYIIGCLAIGMWFCQCATCTVLGINRCVDFWRPKWMFDVFEGKLTLVWIALCLGYNLLGVFYSNSPIFSSIGMAYFFDPYFLIPQTEVNLPRHEYVGVFHSINNIAIVFVLFFLNALLLTSVWWKSRGSTSAALSKMQRRLFIQAFWICLLNFAAALIYVYMQFFPVPAFFIVVAQMTWQCSNGGAVFIYLTLNRTIRNGVLKMLCAPFGKFQVSPLSTTGSSLQASSKNETQTAASVA